MNAVRRNALMLGAVGWLVVNCVTPAPVRAADGYTVAPLGTSENGAGLSPTAINDRGEIVGNHGIFGSYIDAAGVVTPLRGLGGLGSAAFGINNGGLVVGFSDTSTGDDTDPVAYRTDASRVLTRVGTLGGIVSRGFGINDLGQVVGDSGTSILGEASHAFRTDAALVMTDLGTLGGRYSSARAISNSGRVVGESSFSRDLDNEIHAFRTDAAGAMSDLGTLGGTYSRANAINAAGDAVGFAALAGDEVTHAFLAPAGGGMIDLGTFGGAPRSEAAAINDAGQIVGYSFDQRDTGRVPFLYENGRMIDLNTLLPAGSGWTLLEAADINNLGQIVGIGTFGGQQRGFVLTPVPEPAQAFVFAGAGVLVLRRRRK